FLLGIRDGGHYLAVHPVYASGQVLLSPRFVGEDNSGSDDDDQQQRDKQVHKVSILSSYVGGPGGGPCTIPVNASGGDTSGAFDPAPSLPPRPSARKSRNLCVSSLAGDVAGFS